MPDYSSPVDSLAPGSILNTRFRIIENLDATELCKNYLGRDIKTNNYVVVKELIESFEDQAKKEQAAKQFKTEASILIGLVHPAIPTFRDYFEFQNRRYIIMDYVQGKNLYDLVKASDKFLEENLILKWAMELSDVLKYLHNRQPSPVIFRALFPQNIILSKEGKLKLIDFGISKKFNPQSKTMAVVKMGTPHFSPMEQYAGFTDSRSDIYSLGATIYYLITKNLPVDAIERSMNDAPLPKCREYNDKISLELEKIVFKAMEVEKEKRYQNIEDMESELRNISKISSWFKEKEKSKAPSTTGSPPGRVPIVNVTGSIRTNILDRTIADNKEKTDLKERPPLRTKRLTLPGAIGSKDTESKDPSEPLFRTKHLDLPGSFSQQDPSGEGEKSGIRSGRSSFSGLTGERPRKKRGAGTVVGLGIEPPTPSLPFSSEEKPARPSFFSEKTEESGGRFKSVEAIPPWGPKKEDVSGGRFKSKDKTPGRFGKDSLPSPKDSSFHEPPKPSGVFGLKSKEPEKAALDGESKPPMFEMEIAEEESSEAPVVPEPVKKLPSYEPLKAYGGGKVFSQDSKEEISEPAKPLLSPGQSFTDKISPGEMEEKEEKAVTLDEAFASPLMGNDRPLDVGTVVNNRYEVLELVGSGQTTRTYRACDNKSNSDIALKELLDDFDDPVKRREVIMQFQIEAKILIRLEHPSIPKFEEYFSYNGRRYFVIEFVRGESFEEIVRNSETLFDEQTLLDWTRQLCDIIDYMHSQKPEPVIYRDMAPKNIILTDEGKVKIIDFGISKLFSPDTKTMASAKVVNPHFSPLEQYAAQTDERTDIYSLGATLYYLSTKNPPVDAIDRSISSVELKPCRMFNKNISQGFENIILKAMEVDKDKRYQSIKEMIGELENHSKAIAPSPVAAPPVMEIKGKASLPTVDKNLSSYKTARIVKKSEKVLPEKKPEKPKARKSIVLWVILIVLVLSCLTVTALGAGIYIYREPVANFILENIDEVVEYIVEFLKQQIK